MACTIEQEVVTATGGDSDDELSEGEAAEEPGPPPETADWGSVARCFQDYMGKRFNSIIGEPGLLHALTDAAGLAIILSTKKGGSQARVIAATAAAAVLCGRRQAVELVGKDPFVYLPKQAWRNKVLNGEEHARIQMLHDAIGQPGAPGPNDTCKPVLSLMICARRSTGGTNMRRSCFGAVAGVEHPFWAMVHVFPLLLEGQPCVVHALMPLQSIIPGLLWPPPHQQSFGVDADLISTILADLRSRSLHLWAEETDIPSLLGPANSVCDGLEALFRTALEGDHFVPRLGGACVEAFQQQDTWAQMFRQLGSDLKSVWIACDNEAFIVDGAGQGMTLACAIADVHGPDCPLVYVSPGFETLTAYSHEFACGRNCRFLQPNEGARNEAFNGPELRRMRHFCKEEIEGQIFTLLLNEAKTGEPFWNLLYMQHVHLPDRVHPNGKPEHYIFGLQTNIEMQKDIMDAMMPWEWTLESLALLQRLRDILQEKEQTFKVSERSFVALANDVTAQWIHEVGRCLKSSWEGGHYCPLVGHGSVTDFAGKWPELANTALRSVMALNRIQDVVADATSKGAAMDDLSSLVCAVADPSSIDCPLIFISDAFTEMTGYDKSFALGRNCRFLQPNCPDMNKMLNGDELQRMRDFCKKPSTPGQSIINLLLNERRDGIRFWNLLHMTHVELTGERYILAVQINLDLPMPEPIKYRDISHVDKHSVYQFSEKLGKFLTDLRPMLRMHGSSEIGTHAKGALSRIMAYFKENSDDYEGDNYVPYLGANEVHLFQSILSSWSGSTIPERLNRTLNMDCLTDDSKFLIMDPAGSESVVVFVSGGFERATGYRQKWILGRSNKIMQPKRRYHQRILNGEELHSLKSFLVQPAGTRAFSLQAAETQGGLPVWSFTFMEIIELNGRRYIFSFYILHDEQLGLMTELRALDLQSQQELQRLRTMLAAQCKKLCSISNMGDLLSVYEDVVSSTVCRWQSSLTNPAISRCVSHAGQIPIAGFEITPKTRVSQAVPDALENGLRHFHVTFPEAACVDDRVNALEGPLMAMKIAELMHLLESCNFDYILSGCFFSLRTPPHLFDAFHHVQKALGTKNKAISAWFLDATNANLSHVTETWMKMAAAKKGGLVENLGLYGGGKEALQAIQRKGYAKINMYGIDIVPGKPLDYMATKILSELQDNSTTIIACNMMGPRCCLLQSEHVRHAAQHFRVNPVALLIRWAELQGFGATIVPALSAKAALEAQQGTSTPPEAASGAALELPVYGTGAPSTWPTVHRTLVNDILAIKPSNEDVVLDEMLKALAREHTPPKYLNVEANLENVIIPSPLKQRRTIRSDTLAGRVTVLPDVEADSPRRRSTSLRRGRASTVGGKSTSEAGSAAVSRIMSPETQRSESPAMSAFSSGRQTPRIAATSQPSAPKLPKLPANPKNEKAKVALIRSLAGCNAEMRERNTTDANMPSPAASSSTKFPAKALTEDLSAHFQARAPTQADEEGVQTDDEQSPKSGSGRSMRRAHSNNTRVSKMLGRGKFLPYRC